MDVAQVITFVSTVFTALYKLSSNVAKDWSKEDREKFNDAMAEVQRVEAQKLRDDASEWDVVRRGQIGQ